MSKVTSWICDICEVEAPGLLPEYRITKYTDGNRVGLLDFHVCEDCARTYDKSCHKFLKNYGSEDNFEIESSVELKVKDHEYIEKLERENVELKAKLAKEMAVIRVTVKPVEDKGCPCD